MLWFNFILGLNIIFLWFKLIIIHTCTEMYTYVYRDATKSLLSVNITD